MTDVWDVYMDLAISGKTLEDILREEEEFTEEKVEILRTNINEMVKEVFGGLMQEINAESEGAGQEASNQLPLNEAQSRGE